MKADVKERLCAIFMSYYRAIKLTAETKCIVIPRAISEWALKSAGHRASES